jgi:hypothetical protein
MSGLIDDNAHEENIALLEDAHPMLGGIGCVNKPVTYIDHNAEQQKIPA